MLFEVFEVPAVRTARGAARINVIPIGPDALFCASHRHHVAPNWVRYPRGPWMSSIISKRPPPRNARLYALEAGFAHQTF